MCGIAQSSQLAQGSCVGEVDLWGLDEPLSDVREVRTEHDQLIRRFGHRQPSLDRVDHDPDVPRDIGEVQELSAPGGEDFQEALVSREIPDLPEGAYVSLRGITAAGSRPLRA